MCSLRQSFAYWFHKHNYLFDSGYVQLFASGYVQLSDSGYVQLSASGYVKLFREWGRVASFPARVCGPHVHAVLR